MRVLAGLAMWVVGRTDTLLERWSVRRRARRRARRRHLHRLGGLARR